MLPSIPNRYPAVQPWNTPPSERPAPTKQPEHESGDKSSSRPNLGRNEPVIKYKSGKKAGGSKKTAQDGNEKLVVCIRVCVHCFLHAHATYSIRINHEPVLLQSHANQLA